VLSVYVRLNGIRPLRTSYVLGPDANFLLGLLVELVQADRLFWGWGSLGDLAEDVRASGATEPGEGLVQEALFRR
jgi:hypothetical protein